MRLYIKAYKYTLLVTFLAALIPIFGQLLHINFKEITYLPLAVTFIVFSSIGRFYKFTVGEAALLLSLGFYLALIFATGVGVGSGGSLYIIVLCLLFIRFFPVRIGVIDEVAPNLVKFVLFFYKFNIIYLYVELIFVIAGFQRNLINLLTKSDSLPGYKWYNHAHFLNSIGFDHVTGLGGLYMGSQSAGMMAVMSLFVFLQFNAFLRYRTIWILFAIGAVFFCSNMTALVMLTVGFVFKIFIFIDPFNKRIFKLLFFISLPFFIPIIFFKIDNDLEYEVYLAAFLPAIELFVNNILEFNLTNLLVGHGSTGHMRLTELGVGFGTDLGLLTLINQSGLINFFICITPIFLFNLKAFFLSRKIHREELLQNNRSQLKIYSFYILNLVLINILFVSLIHYTSAVEVGLRDLFALHLCFVILIQRYYSNYFSTNRYKGSKIERSS